ncbi:hypothetical protein GGI13_008574, partial [Coemansia sp. RSA 455]
MSESYTTQDNDYLSAAHHTQPTSAAGRSDSTGPTGSTAATPDFLANALSTSRASNNSTPPSVNSAIGTSASGADRGNGSAGSMSLPTMVPPAAGDDASCAGGTLATSAMPSLSQSQIISLKRQPLSVDSASATDISATTDTAIAVSGTAIGDGTHRSVGLCEAGSVALSHSVMAVCRGTKRRGSDFSVIFMAVGTSDRDEHSQSAYSTQTTSNVSASPTTSSRKRRSLNVSPPESPASPGGFSPLRRSPSLSLSPSPPSATLAQPICGGGSSCVPGLGHLPNTASAPSPSSSPSSERPLLPRSARRLLLAPQLMTTRRGSHHGGASGASLRSPDSGGNLGRTQICDGLSVPRDSDCTTSHVAPES